MAVGTVYMVLFCVSWGSLEDSVAQRPKASDSFQHDMVSEWAEHFKSEMKISTLYLCANAVLGTHLSFLTLL